MDEALRLSPTQVHRLSENGDQRNTMVIPEHVRRTPGEKR
jgi:hypothetical protein